MASQSKSVRFEFNAEQKTKAGWFFLCWLAFIIIVLTLWVLFHLFWPKVRTIEGCSGCRQQIVAHHRTAVYRDAAPEQISGVPAHTVDVYNQSGGIVTVYRLQPDYAEIASSESDGLVTKVKARDNTLGMHLRFKVSGMSGQNDYFRDYNFVHDKGRTHYTVYVGKDLTVTED